MDYFKEYNLPYDLKKMSLKEIESLNEEIRDFLVRKVSDTGGHLSSNLGIVELAVGLHTVFDSPKDKIIWDVGHQSYVHKILTGRASGFDSLRKYGGMSGFPKQSESEHDIFDTGHASNSISLALGLSSAQKLMGEESEVIAVIGDGSMTGGMAYEGLNNLGASDSKVIVVLNDNGMSIEESTGGLSMHLNKVILSSNYKNAKDNVKTALNKVPVIGHHLSDGVSSLKQSLKYAIVDDGAFFEALGVKYMGPFDGNDMGKVLSVLEMAKSTTQSVLIHFITTKGKGYEYAEKYPDKFHGIGTFNPETGETSSSSSSYSSIFGKKLTNMALKDNRITAVCAAMIKGTGLSIFSETLPERTFNCGIAEEHAVSFAAGLAKEGLRPFVCIYSTFLQRAYDQILQDVCLQNLPVVFCLDRAGIVGADGETHHGIYDISYLSSMPNMTILSPSCYDELEMMMDYALTLNGPCAIRYPRGSEVISIPECINTPLSFAKAQVLRTGNDITIWAEGKCVSQAMEISDILSEKNIECGVINSRFVAPLDIELIDKLAVATSLLVTLEDNVLAGGLGEKISAVVKDRDLNLRVLRLGWPDCFVKHGTDTELRDDYELSSKKITERINSIIER